MVNYFIKLLSFTPFGVLRIASSFIFILLYRVIGYRKQVVMDNLKKVFKDASSEDIKYWTRKFYKSLSDLIVEDIKVNSMSRKQMREHFVIKNPEVVQEYYDHKIPIVFLGAHVYNWEWLIPGVSSYFDRTYALYKPLSNKSIDTMMLNIRSRFDSVPVKNSEAMKKMVKIRQDGPLVGALTDQSPWKGSKKIWVKLFGIETPVYAGIDGIPRLLKCPVVFLKLRRLKQFYYELELVPLGTPPYEKGDNTILKNYLQVIEEAIHEDPSSWLWSHKRWKYTRKPEEPLLTFE